MIRPFSYSSIIRSLAKWVGLPIALVMALFHLWTSPALATGIYDLPTLSSGDPTWVLDEADVLSRINQGSLSRKLEQLAEQTGSEVRLVTIHRLDYGETVQSFTDQLFEKWFPTPEAQANQVLLVLDNVTNNAAIRTGSAINSLLTDEITESVTQETMMAPLRDGNRYNQALIDAGDRLVAVLSGQPDPGPPAVKDEIQVEGTFTSAEDTDSNNATVLVIGFLVAATIIPMATYYAYKLLGN